MHLTSEQPKSNISFSFPIPNSPPPFTNRRKWRNLLPGDITNKHPVTVLVLISRDISCPVHGVDRPPLVGIVACSKSATESITLIGAKPEEDDGG